MHRDCSAHPALTRVRQPSRSVHAWPPTERVCEDWSADRASLELERALGAASAVLSGRLRATCAVPRPCGSRQTDVAQSRVQQCSPRDTGTTDAGRAGPAEPVLVPPEHSFPAELRAAYFARHPPGLAPPLLWPQEEIRATAGDDWWEVQAGPRATAKLLCEHGLERAALVQELQLIANGHAAPFVRRLIGVAAAPYGPAIRHPPPAGPAGRPCCRRAGGRPRGRPRHRHLPDFQGKDTLKSALSRKGSMFHTSKQSHPIPPFSGEQLSP
ncbi:uncharacterized protein LOC109366383 [Meleagris gallopavo]|uniref:uncharacterized protein LOC109366383 n=1 Tax=Meleagris gallopavo TaxID=9103 RepID=UPI0012AC3946|nr:uncharacterized protein LOC109366383 [Meleagris gallopavo]